MKKALKAVLSLLLTIALQQVSFAQCSGVPGAPIVNITFGSGSTNPAGTLSTVVSGASTTYTFMNATGTPPSTVNDGAYSIVNQVPTNLVWYQGYLDHTTDINGYMAFFNASYDSGVFYRQTVSDLCAGTTYVFSAWIANVFRAGNPTVPKDPKVNFRIYSSTNLVTPLTTVSTGSIPPGLNASGELNWLQYSATFTVPTGVTSVVLVLSNAETGGWGNDLAIDDITFSPCGPSMKASFSSPSYTGTKTICVGQNADLYGTVAGGLNTPAYQWQVSNDNGATWTNISGATSLNYTLINRPLGVSKYRLLTAESGNINSPNCRFISNDITLTVDACCSDTCFWKLTGNNIINGNNIFGTLTQDNIRIFTANQPVGIITTAGRYGFGTATPGNRVEINSGASGISGLRFSNLSSATPGLANTSGKVLSVDAAGDVVLVNDGGAGGTALASNGVTIGNNGHVNLGQDCLDGTGAELLSDRAIPMNHYNLIFQDGEYSPGGNRIGIGTSCQPGAKLEVIRNDEALDVDADPIAISGINKDYTSRGSAYGVLGEAGNPKNHNNYAGKFEAMNGYNNTYGVTGLASSHGMAAVGGYFKGCGAYENIGVYGEASQGCDHSGAGQGNSGFGPNYAGYFNGDVVSTDGFYFISDRTIKKNIQSIPNALELLDKIQPKKYEFDNSKYPGLSVSGTKDNYGVIAQELELVLPSLIKETPIPDGKQGFLKEKIKAVNYIELIPILIQAIKDQQEQIEQLKYEVSKQTAIDSKSNTNDGAYLAQNIPNPFTSTTVINYRLPAATKKASIGIYDMNGRELKQVALSAEREGSITINANELPSGMYFYSLIVNGKLVDSKKMILTAN